MSAGKRFGPPVAAMTFCASEFMIFADFLDPRVTAQASPAGIYLRDLAKNFFQGKIGIAIVLFYEMIGVCVGKKLQAVHGDTGF